LGYGWTRREGDHDGREKKAAANAHWSGPFGVEALGRTLRGAVKYLHLWWRYLTQALRELLREEKAPPDQIKAGLTALRAARERTVQELVKTRQNLRQVMTLRQEALLVLNGLLD
jgi:hypothetical protein